ncbi:MAG TPA: hypothetical protein VM616_10155, partial [Gammaproteobacteria bacterium]|nr:hypothetical protein [Gammaproteobacteria bacterium]
MTPRLPTVIRTLCLILPLAAPPLCAATPALAADPDIHRSEVSLVEGRIVGEDDVIRVTRGERVELAWSSDQRIRLHLHGYDLELEVTPDEPAIMSFIAHATGRFPITRHGGD